jgi:hypothetical protein
MKKVKRVRPLSLGKMFGAIYGVMGLIAGGAITIFSILGKSLSTTEGDFGGSMFGVGAIILVPLIYGVMGFVLGVISGWLYNIAAKLVGGVEVEIEE